MHVRRLLARVRGGKTKNAKAKFDRSAPERRLRVHADVAAAVSSFRHNFRRFVSSYAIVCATKRPSRDIISRLLAGSLSRMRERHLPREIHPKYFSIRETRDEKRNYSPTCSSNLIIPEKNIAIISEKLKGTLFVRV